MTLAELGSEAGLLEAVLALAERRAAAGRAPFAALVVWGRPFTVFMADGGGR